MTTSARLGVGLISVGWMGRLHSNAYLAAPRHFPDLPARADLVIAADPDEGGRRHATDALGYRRAVEDYHELLADPEVDIVSIASPNFLHHQIALDTIAAGKPFWIEKPMGRNAQESKEIAQAAEAAGLITSVGFNYRHVPAIEKLRQLVKDGSLGTITNVRCALLADYSNDPLDVLTWRFINAQAGSGVLGDLLSHGFDLVRYTVGAIRSVSALARTFIPERPLPGAGDTNRFTLGINEDRANAPKGTVENEDYAAVLAQLEGNAVAVFESTRVATGPHAEYTLEVYGTRGSARWNFERMNELLLADDKAGYRNIMAGPSFPGFSAFQPGAGTSMGFDDLKTIEAAQFLESVHTGRQLAPSAADGWAAAEIASAALASAQCGQWVDVPPATGRTTV
jgi:predicted dehydrogenase